MAGNPQASRAMRLYQSGKAKSLKSAWAMVKHGGGSSPKHHSGGKAGSSSSSTKQPQRLGAAYLHASRGADLAGPIIYDVGHRVEVGSDLNPMHIGADVKALALSPGYGLNVGLTIADVMLDKKFGQAAAISRGSVTAIVPEIYPLWVAYEKTKTYRGLSRFNNAYAWWEITRKGYNPGSKAIQITPETIAYRVAHHGGQVARHLLNRSSIGEKIKRPLQDYFLKPLGLTA